MAKFQWRYVPGFIVPQKIPTGYVLCHNHIMHTNDMHCDVNGFRAWFSLGKPPAGYVKCPCGWSGLPHYRLAPGSGCDSYASGPDPLAIGLINRWIKEELRVQVFVRTSADAVRATIRNRADFGDVDPYSNRDYRGDLIPADHPHLIRG